MQLLKVTSTESQVSYIYRMESNTDHEVGYPCLIWVCFLWSVLCVQGREEEEGLGHPPMAGRSLLTVEKRIEEHEHEPRARQKPHFLLRTV